MANERDGNLGQLSGPPITISAHIRPQPDNSWFEVTVLRTHKLPRLETLWGKERRFYVTVTDGTITKKTTTVRSVEQAVEWNEGLDAFAVFPSTHITLSLYARRSIVGKDVLIGTHEIPLESQNEISFTLSNVDTSQPVTLYLTTNLSVNSRSTATHNNPITTQVGNFLATELTADTSVAPNSTEPMVSSTTERDDISIGNGTHDPPMAEMLPENALRGADDAVGVMNLYTTWQDAVGRIKWVMDTLSTVADLNPYAKMAWGILSMIPQTFLSQVQRDENIQALLITIHDAFDFAEEAGPLKNIESHSKQADILKLMLQHVCHCSDFIQSYAQDMQFWKRWLKNIGSPSDDKIAKLCDKLVQLRKAFLDHATVATEIKVLQILDHVDTLSKQISDLDLDGKMSEIPYKQSGMEADYLWGTRTDFLDYIVKWVDDPGSKRALVLFGQAGTGKSSIAHEIARRFRVMNRLSSYFIFLRGERSKHEDYLLFTTILHDLSNRYPSFKNALGKAIRDNKPLRAAKDYHTLFESLLLQPLKDIHTVGPILIIIDALDESGDATGRDGLHTFLAKNLAKLPPNFRILITSRPEVDIMLPFANASGKPYEIIHMDDSKLAARTKDDILIYLQEKLPMDTFRKHGNELAEKAEGLFQWAAVACGYINYPPRGLTKNDCIRALLKLSADHEELGQKLGPLYDLYKQVLEGYFESPIVRRRFQSVMGQLLAAFEPLSISSLTALRQYPLDDPDDDDSVVVIVRQLGSLLSNVTLADQTLPIVPLHTSFRDFLTDKKMADSFYHIDLGQAHRQLAHSCLGLMLHDLQFNICKLESSHLPNSKIPDLDTRINAYIPPALFYACCFWDDHLERLGFEQDLLVKLRSLFEEKFLFWLEVLSLKNFVAYATPALSTLQKWLASDQHHEAFSDEVKTFQELVIDASAFLRYFGMVIAKSAPHIYVSALPFAPLSSQVSRHYSSMFTNTLSVKLGQLSHWPAMEMVIPAGEQRICSVAFSQDGQRIVSGSSDKSVCIWNATTGVMEVRFTGHSDDVYSVAFSQDGRWIVSGSSDGTIRVWNATTGVMEGSPLIGHTGRVRCVAFSQDGQRIVSGSSDKSVRIWNATTGVMEGRPFTGHIGGVHSVAFSQDGQWIVSGSDDRTVCVWNARTGVMEGRPLTGHTDWVHSVTFSQDGQRIVSGSADSTICVWNARTGVMEGRPFTGHTEPINSVAFSQDGQWIVSGSDDQTIRVWNARTGVMEGRPFTGHTDWVHCVAFSQDGQRIVSGSSDATIRVWNATTRVMEGSPFFGYTDDVYSVAFSQDGQQIVSGSSDGAIRVWNTATGVMEGGPFTGHTHTVGSVALSQDGQRIVSGSHDWTICVWNVTTGLMEGRPLAGHTHMVCSVAFSQDGQWIASGSADGTICVWNTTMGVMEGSPFTGHTDWVHSVAFSWDGQWIVSGSADRTVCVWNARTGVMEGSPFTGHTDSVISVTFSQDGQWIVSASIDRTVRVWNTRTGVMEGRPLTGHTNWVRSVAFSQDGQQIVSGSDDGKICVWNSRTGVMEGRPLTGHTGHICSVAFLQDGQQIISGSKDGTICLWNTMRGKMAIAEPTGFTDQSRINSEGWIHGSEDELLVWIPNIHRVSLHRPSTLRVIGGHETCLDLSKFVHGPKWATCYNNQNIELEFSDN
ncbi:WD40 repeat-like protein [Phlegmacium glaucopus]|nr:WD40 repeat-like protein [Phlegmacium glaucopus]